MLRWSAAPASLTFLSLRVYAIGKKKKDFSSPVRADDLSVYSVPDLESHFVEEPRSSLEEVISRMRKAAMPYASWVLDLYSQTRPGMDGGLLQGPAGSDPSDHLCNSPSELLRSLLLIGVPGVLGYLLAQRSKVKKLLYPAGLMAVTTTIHYPQDAFRVAALCGEKLRAWSLLALAELRRAWRADVQEDLDVDTPKEVKHLFKQGGK